MSFQAGQINEGFIACNDVLDDEPENLDALIDRAETYIINEQYDEGNFKFMFLCTLYVNILQFTK